MKPHLIILVDITSLQQASPFAVANISGTAALRMLQFYGQGRCRARTMLELGFKQHTGRNDFQSYVSIHFQIYLESYVESEMQSNFTSFLEFLCGIQCEPPISSFHLSVILHF